MDIVGLAGGGRCPRIQCSTATGSNRKTHGVTATMHLADVTTTRHDFPRHAQQRSPSRGATARTLTSPQHEAASGGAGAFWEAAVLPVSHIIMSYTFKAYATAADPLSGGGGGIRPWIPRGRARQGAVHSRIP